jgi:hypothetical protein
MIRKETKEFDSSLFDGMIHVISNRLFGKNDEIDRSFLEALKSVGYFRALETDEEYSNYIQKVASSL